MFVLFSAVANVPFIECDDQTYDDQVYVFSDEKDLQRYAQIYTKEKYALKGVNYPRAQLSKLFEQLYCLGVDTLQVVDGGAPVTVKLADLAEPPAYPNLPNPEIPTMNPELQLSAAYFMQELRRPVERDTKEKKRLRELEEEMAVNLMRSKFIVVFDITQVKGKWKPGEKTNKLRIPLVKNKSGKTFQPVYTDFSEFRRFSEKNRGMRMGIQVVDYDLLAKMLAKGADGFVFNPGGFNMVLSRGQLERMKERYGEN